MIPLVLMPFGAEVVRDRANGSVAAAA
jgi:hypothetical protein